MALTCSDEQVRSDRIPRLLQQEPYPLRLRLRPLPEFEGSNKSRPDPAMERQVEAFVLAQYAAGRSAPEIAEPTDRSFSAVRNIRGMHGTHRRASGAERYEQSERLSACARCRYVSRAPRCNLRTGPPL
jgi:hypothetical protein